VAVRESGVTLFLVPAEQSDEEIAQAQKAAGKSVKIVAVSDLEEALQALRQNGGDPLTLKK
jgi:PDZ domain-containing secreted protein